MSNPTPDQRPDSGRWQLDKHVPVTFLFGMLFQTFIFVWGAAILYSKVDYAIETLKTFAVERYTKDDARRDRELSDAKYADLFRRQAANEEAIRRFDIDSPSARRP